MSNSTSAIKEIKNLMVQFGFLTAEPTLLDFKLEDNTILQAEALKVGKNIFKINELFEKVTLEDGSYVIPNDFELEVVDGKIAVVKEIFIDAKLKDGTDVSIKGAGVEVGAKIFVVKDGVPTPAPDDTHILEDGTEVTTKDGEIVAVETPAEEVMAVEGSPAEEATESPAEEGKEPISPAEKMNPEAMAEMYDMLKEFIVKCGQKMSEMEGQYNSLQNEFNSFKKEPAGKAITYSKTDYNKEIENVLESRLKALDSLKNK
jgi:hypothetical protein